MTYTPTPNFFLPGLDRVAKARHEIAHHFQQIINTLQQAEQGRKELMKVTKKEFLKHLPQITEQQSSLVEQVIKDCFDT